MSSCTSTTTSVKAPITHRKGQISDEQMGITVVVYSGVVPGVQHAEALQVVDALRELQVPEVDQGIRGMGCGATAMAVPGRRLEPGRLEGDADAQAPSGVHVFNPASQMVHVSLKGLSSTSLLHADGG